MSSASFPMDRGMALQMRMDVGSPWRPSEVLPEVQGEDVGQSMIFEWCLEDLHVLHAGSPLQVAADVDWGVDAMRALNRETGCSWAPWSTPGYHSNWRCMHGLMINRGVPLRILDGAEMPDVADWLRREHADQLALINKTERPEGHDEPYRPVSDEELPPW